MIDVINFFIGIVLLVFGFIFAYVSSVLIYERKTGKPYKMFWESKGPAKFDKQGVVKYNKGDNT